jgi:hypothetical protein
MVPVCLLSWLVDGKARCWHGHGTPGVGNWRMQLRCAADFTDGNALGPLLERSRNALLGK